jgi:hypothetical protein
MKINSETHRHVRKVDSLALCGELLDPLEFKFVSLDHALTHIEHSKLFEACSECLEIAQKETELTA